MPERLAAIVAIPVRDEAERIPACLNALAMQRNGYGQPLRADTFGVVLMLNNCADDTADIVRQMRDRLPFCVWVVERQLPAMMAHAGWARKLAMDAAADLLSAGETAQPRVIMTTDADARVGPRWISVNLATIAAGADLVAGFVRADRAEHARLPIAAILSGGNWKAATNGCSPSCSHEWILRRMIPGHAIGSRPAPAYEPWRISHTGNVYQRFLYKENNGKWYPLELLCNRALVEKEQEIAFQMWQDFMSRVSVPTKNDR